ncbi:MAG TPA: OFA family MFS transporter [Ktedonobacteraceae bacterium]
MSSSTNSSPNRWVIAIAAFLVQLALGAVYAWSVFLTPVMKLFNASKGDATTTFTLTLVALSIAAGFGGYFQNRFGPRVVATVGGLLYGIGIILAGFAPSLFVLYLTYGIISGIGIGLGYIVPLAMLIKWFPDRRGFITGLAVAGFGLGALITSPVAAALIQANGVQTTFIMLGIVYLIVVVVAAQFFRRAPEGYAPAGWQPSVQQQLVRSSRDYTLSESLGTVRWYILWLILALNVTAGAALIAVASPMAVELTGVSTVTAALLVSTNSAFNGVGRLFWGWVSDAIGRPTTFLIMFALQCVVFLLIPFVGSFGLLIFVSGIILLCYGGGFGTMPAFAADFFGPKNSGVIYGTMLTAWGAGAILGPQLIARVPTKTALFIISGIMLVSMVLPLITMVLTRRRTIETKAVAP